MNSIFIPSLNIPFNTNKSVYDPNEFYGSPKSACSLCGTRTPGSFSPAFEVFTFTGIVDLSSVPANCCWVNLKMNLNNRSNNISNILNPSNLSAFRDIQINLCDSGGPNTSPVFNSIPRLLTCVYNDYFFNLNATDADGDSLSYRLGDVENSPNNPVVYQFPYSKNAPLPYLGFPSTNPNFQPPLGFQVNPISGLVQFRPTMAFYTPLNFEVLKWRKINGVPTLMGIVTREVDHSALPCYGTQPNIRIYDMNGTPITAADIRVCESKEACFIVAANDGFTNADTTILEFANTPGLSVQPYYNPATRRTLGPIHDSVKICMQHSPNTNLSSKSFLISIAGRDKTLPISMSTHKSFTLISMAEPKVRLLASSTGNMGRKIYLGRLNTVPFNAGLTNWNIENFPGSNSFSTFTAKDTVSFTFSGGGWYKVNYELTAECGKISINDSLFIGGFSLFAFQNQAQICAGDSTASIATSAAGAIGNPKFRINNDTFQTQSVFSNLPSGSYKIYGKDEANNIDSVTVVIPVKTALQLSHTKVLPKCSNDSSGQITLSATGGQPNYKYVIGADTSNNGIFSAVPSGLIPVKLIDQTGCIKVDTVNLIGPSRLKLELSTTPDLCNGTPNGAAFATVSGGTAPYSISWLNNTPGSQLFYGGLFAGVYPVKVIDAKSCVLDTSFRIMMAPITHTPTSICAINVLYPLQKKQVISWNKIPSNQITHYQIWESTDSTIIFNLKQTFLASAPGICYDTIHVEDNPRKFYRVMALDSCGRVSYDGRMPSAFTFELENYLQISGNFPVYQFNYRPKLTWKKPTVLNTIMQYRVYRKGVSSDFVLVQTLGANDTMFIDSTFKGNGQTLHYYVEAVPTASCNGQSIKSHSQVYSVLSVSEYAALAKEFKLYPNPASRFLTVQSIQSKSFKQLKLLTIDGKHLETYSFNDAQKEVQLALPSLAKGMYYLLIELEELPTVSLPFMVE
ncbi:MAG: T9SS type A sorting domain-containing protein [Bacteroidia bacterium]|nr:T9SS type A sorting domain-containing protein [Bacteroidia bacterium]